MRKIFHSKVDGWSIVMLIAWFVVMMGFAMVVFFGTLHNGVRMRFAFLELIPFVWPLAFVAVMLFSKKAHEVHRAKKLKPRPRWKRTLPSVIK